MRLIKKLRAISDEGTRIVFYRQHRDAIAAQGSEIPLMLAPEAVQFARACGIQIFGGADIGGSCAIHAQGIVDIWIDLSEAIALATGTGCSTEAAVEASLLHELGHLAMLSRGDRSEDSAWMAAVDIWSKLPHQICKPHELANCASFAVNSHRLGRAPKAGEWKRIPAPKQSRSKAAKRRAASEAKQRFERQLHKLKIAIASPPAIGPLAGHISIFRG